MCKNYSLIFLFFIFEIFDIHTQIPQHNQIKTQNIKVENKTTIPVICNIFVSGTASGVTVGYYGILLPAKKNKEQAIPEFFWFEKQGTGGVRKPGESSKVRVIDVLKHGFANTLEIIIPDDKKYNFSLEPKEYTIVITQENGKNQVILQEQKVEVPKKKSFFGKIEEEIEKRF